MQRAHSQGRGQQSADKQQPEPRVDPEVAHKSEGDNDEIRMGNCERQKPVREETSSEHTEGASKHRGAKCPKANVKLWIVELEKVSRVVCPAVTSSVTEKS